LRKASPKPARALGERRRERAVPTASFASLSETIAPITMPISRWTRTRPMSPPTSRSSAACSRSHAIAAAFIASHRRDVVDDPRGQLVARILDDLGGA